MRTRPLYMLPINVVLRSLMIAIVAIGCAKQGDIAKADEQDILAVVERSIPRGTDTALAHRRMREGGFECQHWAVIPVDHASHPTIRLLRCTRPEPSVGLPDRALRVSLAYTDDHIDSVLLALLPQTREVEGPRY